MGASEPARGIRNNNPGNIRRGATKWQGQVAPDKQTDPAFIQFVSAQYGIRAIARTILTYQAAYKINTVRKCIHRWAPPNENDTDAYVTDVAREVGVDCDAAVDFDDAPTMVAVVRAIIRHENGRQPYADAIIAEGVRMAGVHDAKAPLVTARLASGVASFAATGSAGALAISGTLDQVRQAVSPYAEHSATVVKVVGALATIGAGLMALKIVLDLIHHRATGA